MKLTWWDVHHMGCTTEVRGLLPNPSDPLTELETTVDADQAIFVEMDEDSHSFQYAAPVNGEGSETWIEFDDLDALDTDDPEESPIWRELEFSISVDVPVPLTARERRKCSLDRYEGFTPSTGSELVACKATRVSYTVEERTVEFHGEPLTYYHYKALYAWKIVEGRGS